MMRQCGGLQTAARPAQVPVALRFLGKLIVEVLPAALASVIGAFLFAHYQFGRPAEPAAAAPVASAVPASSEMLQVVREEHAMISDFLAAERTAQQSRIAAADAADARAAVEAKPAASAPRRAAVALIVDKPAAARANRAPIAAVAAAGYPGVAAEPTPILIAGIQPDPSLAPPPPPAHPSLVGATLAVPGHVVSMTLHAVMAIGGIPSWIGHRVGGADLDADGLATGTAS